MKKTILIVDDDETLLLLMAEALRKDNHYEIHAVSDPQEAYRLASTRRFDLLIADFKMPTLRGDTLYLCLGVDMKDPSKAPDRPKLLLISGAISEGELNLHMEYINGAATLSKPFSMDTLRGKVAELLGPAEADDAA